MPRDQTYDIQFDPVRLVRQPIEDARTGLPAHVDEFRAHEAMAPERDGPVLERLTGHEVAAIARFGPGTAGGPNATGPLPDFLCMRPEREPAS